MLHGLPLGEIMPCTYVKLGHWNSRRAQCGSKVLDMLHFVVCQLQHHCLHAEHARRRPGQTQSKALYACDELHVGPQHSNADRIAAQDSCEAAEQEVVRFVQRNTLDQVACRRPGTCRSLRQICFCAPQTGRSSTSQFICSKTHRHVAYIV